LTARQIVPAVGVPARIDHLLLFSIHFSLTMESIDRQSGTRLACWGRLERIVNFFVLIEAEKQNEEAQG
jgi:hypothetical protein